METIEFLPLVKAYPALSKTYGEVSCVAGVEMSASGPRWIRLYPVPFRSLKDKQQFRKYQPIKVRVSPHRGDLRPETRRPDRDSIEPAGNQIPSTDSWAKRRRWVEPLIVESMCEIRRQQRLLGTSLAAFRPKLVEDLIIEPADVNAAKVAIARAWAAQGSLLSELDGDEKTFQLREIEQIPYRFKYRYKCNDRACKTHEQSIIDWEIVQFYRQIRRQADWRERLRSKWLNTVCASERDTAFFVGNQHQHPGSFMVLGVWWPPRQLEQLSLANLDYI